MSKSPAERRPALCGIAIATIVAIATPASALEIIVGLPYGKHRIGHTAVRVRTPSNGEVVYDFGRYGKTWGELNFRGEGIMRVWRGGKQVAAYLRKQRSYRESVGYTVAVSKEVEKAIYLHYEQRLQTARWERRHGNHIRYRLARDYHGVEHQCTSVALEGWKAVVDRASWERVLHPRYNRGQGFTPTMKRYFDRWQRKLGIKETVVPLDVMDAFEAAVARKDPLVTARRAYSCRGCGR